MRKSKDKKNKKSEKSEPENENTEEYGANEKAGEELVGDDNILSGNNIKINSEEAEAITISSYVSNNEKLIDMQRQAFVAWYKSEGHKLVRNDNNKLIDPLAIRLKTVEWDAHYKTCMNKEVR